MRKGVRSKDRLCKKKKVEFSLRESLGKTINSRPFIFMLRVVILLTVFWYILYGIAILLDMSSLISNTNVVEKKMTKLAVIQEGNKTYGSNEYVLLKDDNTLVFPDKTEKNVSDVKGYIRTVPGASMWYTSDDQLVVPYLVGDLIREGVPFYLVSIVLFIIAILYAKRKKQAKSTILVGLSISAFILSILEFIVAVIYSYSFNWYSMEYTNMLFYGLIGYTLVKLICIVIYNTKGVEKRSMIG